MKKFRVAGKFYYSYVERHTGTKNFDELIWAEDESTARQIAEDKAQEKVDAGYDDAEIDSFDFKIDSMGEAPTDITIWALPRDIAPTLFPEAELKIL